MHLQKIIRFTLIDAHSDNSHTDTLTKKSCFLIQMWHYWLFPKIIHYKLQGWYLSMFYKFQSGNDIISWYQDSCTWGITYEWWNKAELIDLWCFVTVFGGSRRSITTNLCKKYHKRWIMQKWILLLTLVL